MLAIGDVIRGRYRLLRLLGDGGMGTVYEASHELLGTRVAIKVLHADLARRTGLVDRFLQEARVAAQIKSVHVVQVTDVDRTPEGVAYIVMELLEGEALGAMLDRQRKLTIPMACDFTLQILEALEAAHALGVVHRDLKPENVFVTYQATKPVLKLIDFGIAKLRSNVPGEKSMTVAGVLMGTAEYMAPEQAFSADKVDGRSDIYAVGVLLYEMIAGQRPVQGEDGRAIAMKVERGEVTPLVHVVPEVPREIAGLVHRAMAARPELRFANATEMRLALEGALAGKAGKPGATAAIAAPQKHNTMQAAPVQAAFAPSDSGLAQRDAAPRTERAPGPIAFQQPTPAPTPPSAVTASPVRSRRRGGGGKWALIVIPLLLGAGVVATLVITADHGPAPLSTPTATSPPAWTAPAATTTTPPTPTTAGGAVSALVPSPGTPGGSPHSPGGGHGPHAPGGSPSGSPAGAPSSPASGAPYTPPPFAFPTSLPSFPSSEGGAPLIPFPLPSGFPTTLPSSLPFPFPFPTAAPAESASPSPAKSI